MNRIELVVADVHSAAVPTEAYSLILKEKEGDRYVPVIIGMSEARAILLELHSTPVHRPLTHELFLQLAEKFGCALVQVDIVKYENGVYYADMCFLCEDDTVFHIDARPSDAIALALRYNAPYFMDADIFEQNCMQDNVEETNEDAIDDDDFDNLVFNGDLADDSASSSGESKTLQQMNVSELEWLLNQAIREEDYELAARIKEELEGR